MSIFLSNRNGSGQTDEEGHFKFPTTMWAGNTVNDAAKAVQNSPLGMSVLLTPGDFKIDSGSGFSYTGWIDTPEEVTLPTANPSNPRIDAVVLYVDLSESTVPSPANNPGIIKTAVVSGTPTGFPTTPNDTAIQLVVGAGNPFFRVANVRVNGGVTQVSNTNITDTRVGVTLVPNGAITNTTIADGAVTPGKLINTTHKRYVDLSAGANVISDLPFVPRTVDAILMHGHASDNYFAHGAAWLDEGNNIVQHGMGIYRNAAGTTGNTITSNYLLASGYWSAGLQTNFRGLLSGLGSGTSVTITASNFNSNLSRWVLTFGR